MNAMKSGFGWLRRILAATLLLAMLGCGAMAETVRGDLSGRFEETPTLERDGQTYQYRRGLTTILFMGVDTRLENEDRGDSRSGGQSDFMLLLVIDEENRTITPLQINRDTITEVTVLDLMGNEAGTIKTQLCLSHGFGDGKEQSCEYTCNAVQNLLLGVEIDYYIAMNLDGIPVFNDLMGGVTVTLEDDLTAYDPTMTKGTTLTLQGKQAEYYVRYRFDIADGSNEARMVRQRTYMAELARMVNERLQESADFIGTIFDELEPMLTTNMKRGTMINVAWGAREYEHQSTRTLEGEYGKGADGYVEFYADPEALEDLVIDLFYEVKD